MKYIFTIALVLLVFISFSQNKCSNITRIDLEQIKYAFQNKEKNPFEFETVLNKFPINTIHGERYLSLLTQVNSTFSADELTNKNYLIGKGIKTIRTLKVPLSEISNLQAIQGLEYFEIAGKISQNLDKAIKDIRADSVQKGINLPEAYTGKDVFIGICDWGFDYTHPNFYDTLLTQTRIAGAWDQYRQSTPHPIGFNYGTEFTSPTALLAAQSDTSNIYSYGYHGSHVAGICGGSGAGTVYRGVAFEAQYLMATFLIDGASVIDAYEWMYQKAQAAGKRLVINQSWGLHWLGNLDGTSLLSQAIDGYSDLGVIFVSSAGNNGNVNFHLSKTFNNDELKSKIDFYNYASNANMWGQSLSLWGEPTKEFSTSIQVLNSSNAVLVETPFYSTATTLAYVDSTLITGTDTIFFNVACENANPQNNRPHVRFRVKNTNTALKIVMRVKAVDGTVHCWNVTELTTDVGNWGMPFTSGGISGAVPGNTQYGISEPACTNSTIAVAAYATQYQQGAGTVGGAIASFSSFGPTLDDRVKPDISAPGVNIGSSFSSYTDEAFSPVATVNFNGRDYPFAKISGTSMSGPMVTGIVALILDANPYLSPVQIKDIIKQTARTDNFTGVIPVGGSTRWGAGKINAYAAVLMALDFLGTEEIKQDNFSVYPNPSCDVINLNFDQEITAKTVKIYDLNGKATEVQITDKQINVSNLSTGTYVLKIELKGRVYQQKFVKE